MEDQVPAQNSIKNIGGQSVKITKMFYGISYILSAPSCRSSGHGFISRQLAVYYEKNLKEQNNNRLQGGADDIIQNKVIKIPSDPFHFAG